LNEKWQPHFLFLFFDSALLRVLRGESRHFWLSAERSEAALGLCASW
jgi:hypothetical protein